MASLGAIAGGLLSGIGEGMVSQAEARRQEGLERAREFRRQLERQDDRTFAVQQAEAQRTFQTERDQIQDKQRLKELDSQHENRLVEIEATGVEARKTVAAKPDKPQSRYRALTPDEIKSAGLPAGSSAQIDEATGKIDVLSKRDTTASLSQKDSTTAKMKLNTVTLARQQLNNIRDRFGKLKGSVSAGAFGQGKLPTEAGRAFDRSVDQMRSTLTALTRVPGVGAMSDYETKLDQAKFPTRDEYESVTEQQISDLDNMLNAIETGYKDLLSDGGPREAQSANGPVKVSTPAEAMKLPSGTQFVTPDGRVKVRP